MRKKHAKEIVEIKFKNVSGSLPLPFPPRSVY